MEFQRCPCTGPRPVLPPWMRRESQRIRSPGWASTNTCQQTSFPIFPTEYWFYCLAASGRFCTFVKLLSQETLTMLVLFNNQGVTAASEKCFPWTGQKSPVSVRWGWFFLQERFFGSNLGQTMICHSKVMIWIKPSARRARIRLTCMMSPWRVRMIKNDLLDV